MNKKAISQLRAAWDREKGAGTFMQGSSPSIFRVPGNGFVEKGDWDIFTTRNGPTFNGEPAPTAAGEKLTAVSVSVSGIS